MLVLVALRPWSRMLFSAFVGSVLFIGGWWFEFYSDAQLVRSSLFLGCFFLIFAFAPRLVRLNSTADAHLSGWDTLALVLMPTANAALGFLAFYDMAEAHRADWIEPWMAVGFAAFYMLLLRLPARGTLRASPELLSALHLTAAVVFLTIAIPLKAEGRWLTIGWLVEGAALLWAANRVRNLLLRVLSLICLAIGLTACWWSIQRLPPRRSSMNGSGPTVLRLRCSPLPPGWRGIQKAKTSRKVPFPGRRWLRSQP